MSRENISSWIIVLLLLLLPSLAAAQTPEYEDYTVQKGDTLWDISKKELKDPFLWPKVWKENTEIKNPDKIYPGRRIKIPLYLLQKEVAPEIKTEIKPVSRPIIKPEIQIEKPVEKIVQPPKREYLIPKDVLTASGYIADSGHGVGKIIDSQTGRTALTKGDFAYVKANYSVKKGDKFYVVKVVEKVKHPKTGRSLGYLIEVLGIAEVVSTENSDPKIKITTSFSEVLTGSLLIDFYEIEPSFAPVNPKKPNIDGYIVAARQLHAANGNWDIVYLDKGRADGLEIGDILATTLQSEHKITNAVVQIVDLRDRTSTAIIRKGEIETSIGDGITGIRQE